MNNKVKNIIGIIGLGVLMTSCVSTKWVTTTVITTTYGDISLLDNNGGVVREWDNSTIQGETETTTDYYEFYGGESHWKNSSHSTSTFTSLKNNGLNFTDESGETHYVSGGIIIIDNITSKIDTLITDGKSKNWDRDVKNAEKIKENPYYGLY